MALIVVLGLIVAAALWAGAKWSPVGRRLISWPTNSSA